MAHCSQKINFANSLADINSNLIKYKFTSKDITLNNGFNAINANCPSEIPWENVIAVIPYLSGSYHDVAYTSVGSYAGDGAVYFSVDSHWGESIVAPVKILWLYV